MSQPQPPLISVLMAVHHPHPRFFVEAVQSILRQTFQDFEIIIVEDPSPRCGRDYLAKMADRRIRYFSNDKKTSLAEQRNRGLREARAGLVAIFDADDISEPQRLAREWDFLQQHPEIGLVGSQVCIIDKGGHCRGQIRYPLDHGEIVAALCYRMALCQGSGLYRKHLIEVVGGFQAGRHNAGEDYDLASRLALAGIRLANLPDVLLRYRFHAEQMKSLRIHDVIRGVVQVKRLYWWDKMNWRAKTRFLAEKSLLGLPPWLVLALLNICRNGKGT